MAENENNKPLTPEEQREALREMPVREMALGHALTWAATADRAALYQIPHIAEIFVDYIKTGRLPTRSEVSEKLRRGDDS